MDFCAAGSQIETASMSPRAKACGMSGGDIPTTVTSVSVTPSTANILTLATQQFTATVQGTVTDKSVTWSASSGAITYSVTSGPATITGSTVTITGAGPVILGASQVAAGNYTAATASTSFTIAPEVPTLTFATIPAETFGNAPFTVSASSASRR